MSDANNDSSSTAAERDEAYTETETDGEPGLSGGEYPGSEDELAVKAGDLLPEGESTTFGGALGDYGPAGTMGTIDDSGQ